MYGDTFVGKFKTRTWLYSFCLLQILIFVFIVSSMATKLWVYGSFFGTSFQGSLNASETQNSMSYYSLSLSYCEIYKDTHEKSMSSLCKLFTNLFKAMAFYIAFEVISLSFLALWFYTIWGILKKKDLLKLAIVFAIISCVSHCLACIIWFSITEANFKDDCSDEEINGETPKICASDGPALVIFSTVLHSGLTISYILVTKYAYKKFILPKYRVVPKTAKRCMTVEIPHATVRIGSLADGTPQTASESILTLEPITSKRKRRTNTGLVDVFGIN
ncbi:hypothetical protein SteCoe_18965 [Stentor coeruleus]|uniref:Uncharacterized protein n=1 Tax=Stentor coeruleus TaxID=5963 RepID=A0A1R2BVC1_9CILI|nr:hypothetical protein SteCoe_18965 [Stentor coeruleus]